MIVVDCYSRWLEIQKINRKTTDEVIKNIFSRFGIPEIVVADNNPFNSQEFLKFLKDWDFYY